MALSASQWVTGQPKKRAKKASGTPVAARQAASKRAGRTRVRGTLTQVRKAQATAPGAGRTAAPKRKGTSLASKIWGLVDPRVSPVRQAEKARDLAEDLGFSGHTGWRRLEKLPTRTFSIKEPGVSKRKLLTRQAARRRKKSSVTRYR